MIQDRCNWEAHADSGCESISLSVCSLKRGIARRMALCGHALPAGVIEHALRRGMLRVAIMAWAFPALLILSQPAFAAGGDLDRSFGAGAGYITFAPQYDAHWQMTDALALADGRSVIGGYLDLKYVVRRYFPDGRLDTSFGSDGSTEIPDFSRDNADAGVYSGPRLYSDGASRIIVNDENLGYAASGLARRLDAAGHYDGNYQPRAIKLQYYPAENVAATFLPLPDGRMIFVATQDAAQATSFISVRYFLADGSPDTQRGSTYGERLIGPATGRYEPTHALLQPDGKLLISAYWVQPTKAGIVLLRLNADGSPDESFGNRGVAVIGEDMAGVRAPTLARSETGALALAYFVYGGDLPPGSQSYFVAHLLQADGRPDTGQPMSGQISVALPNESYGAMSPTSLRVAYAASRLSVFAAQFFWQMNLTAGGSVPTVSIRASYPINTNPISSVLGGGYLWSVIAQEPISGGHFLLGWGNSYASVIAVDHLADVQPTEIRDSQRADAFALFSDVKTTGNGSLTAMALTNQSLGNWALFRFASGGAPDTGFGQRGLAPLGDYLSGIHLLDTFADGATVLGLSPAGDLNNPQASVYSLIRFAASGAPEPGFANAGKLLLPGSAFSALRLPSGTLWAVRREYSTDTQTHSLQPILYDVEGKPLGGPAAVQAVGGYVPGDADVALASMSDGGVLAVAGGSDSLAGPWVQLFHWRSDGSAASGSLRAPTFIGEHFLWLLRADLVVNTDDSAVVALGLGGNALSTQPAALLVLVKFKADGTLDASFGDSGKIRIPVDADQQGVPWTAQWFRLLRQSDGKLVLARNVSSGSTSAVVVGRYNADGRPDGTFGTGGNHEVRFTLSDTERVFDMTQASDGKLVLVGQSGRRGLIVRLYGESTPPPVTPVPIVEFYNSNLKHYFITGGTGEIAAIESGAAGPGWSRTGQSFKAFAPETGIAPGAQPVCRFYGTPGVGPNSHFYTVDATECENVKHDPGWTYEGLAFYIFAPSNGTCTSGQVPVYRAYNMRFAQNDSNHRYTTDSATYAQMQAQGWAGEGVKFCAAQ